MSATKIFDELLESRGFGLETPDCGHAVRHIREIFDSTLGKHVFAFDSHRDLDNDRCANFDRQRIEVKTAPGDANQGILQHTNGQTAYYRWKFKLPSGFQASSNFTHIFQIKAQAGSDAGSPLVTITPRAGNPDTLQIIWTPPSGQSGGGVKAQADLSLFRDVWVEAFVQYLSADSGDVHLSIAAEGPSFLSAPRCFSARSSTLKVRTRPLKGRPRWFTSGPRAPKAKASIYSGCNRRVPRSFRT